MERSSSTAFLSPVINRGIRKPFGEITNTPPRKCAHQDHTPLKTCAAEVASATTTQPEDPIGTLTPMTNLKLLMRVASESDCCPSSRRELFKEENQENDENMDSGFSANTSLNSSGGQRLVIADSEIDHDYSFERRNSGGINSILMTPGSLCLSSAPTSASSTTSLSSSNNNKVSRKDKSLGLLCDKFISRFPRQVLANERCEIPLDDLAKQMSTERRRIYDIVNVLEAVQMMTKIGKNLYQWHGTSHQIVILAWLRQLAVKLDMLKRYLEVKRLESEELLSSPHRIHNTLLNLDRDLKRSPLSALSPATSLSSSFSSTPTSVSPSPIERKTSLGVACQKFLMLFLIAPEDKAKINLDFAAKVIHGVGLPEAIMKTRIRRLYDIANILQSLKLIQKVQITELNGGKKPAFQYIGPNVNTIEVTKDVLQKLPFTRQRHSLLTFGKSLMNIPDEPSAAALATSPLAAINQTIHQPKESLLNHHQASSSFHSPNYSRSNIDNQFNKCEPDIGNMVLNLSKKKRYNSESEDCSNMTFTVPSPTEPENLTYKKANTESPVVLKKNPLQQDNITCLEQRHHVMRRSSNQGISLLKRALTSPRSSANLHIVSPIASMVSTPVNTGARPLQTNKSPLRPQVAHQSSSVAFSFITRN